jgi:hypothetical protein
MRARRLAAVALFLAVSLGHFLLSFTGQALALRVAFDTQPGGTARPLDVVLVRLAGILLAPLVLAERVAPGLSTSSGHLEIAVTSVGFGVAAIGALWLWHRRRPMRRRPVEL